MTENIGLSVAIVVTIFNILLGSLINWKIHTIKSYLLQSPQRFICCFRKIPEQNRTQLTEIVTNTVVSLKSDYRETLLSVLFNKLNFLKFKTIIFSYVDGSTLPDNSKQFLIQLRKYPNSTENAKYRASCPETDSDCFGEPDEVLAQLMFQLMDTHKINSATFTISL